MILTTEHVGKKVRHQLWDSESRRLVFLNKNNVCLEDEQGNISVWENRNVWEIIETEKKPSEILNEKLAGSIISTLPNTMQLPEWFFYVEKVRKAIGEVLDEHWGKK